MSCGWQSRSESQWRRGGRANQSPAPPARTLIGRRLMRGLALERGHVKMRRVVQGMSKTSLRAVQARASKRSGRVTAKRKNVTL